MSLIALLSPASPTSLSPPLSCVPHRLPLYLPLEVSLYPSPMLSLFHPLWVFHSIPLPAVSLSLHPHQIRLSTYPVSSVSLSPSLFYLPSPSLSLPLLYLTVGRCGFPTPSRLPGLSVFPPGFLPPPLGTGLGWQQLGCETHSRVATALTLIHPDIPVEARDTDGG